MLDAFRVSGILNIVKLGAEVDSLDEEVVDVNAAY